MTRVTRSSRSSALVALAIVILLMQVILPWPFAPLDRGEPLQQGTPVSWIHADSVQRQTGEIIPATARNPCLGGLSTPNSPNETREVRVVPLEKGEVIVG